MKFLYIQEIHNYIGSTQLILQFHLTVRMGLEFVRWLNKTANEDFREKKFPKDNNRGGSRYVDLSFREILHLPSCLIILRNCSIFAIHQTRERSEPISLFMASLYIYKYYIYTDIFIKFISVYFHFLGLGLKIKLSSHKKENCN